ncbi:hypothetical protein UFOVP468_55 [uncultured Caudovirales phage]|uniref:Uncharacterized protein n=1 Tax=uncultured Caudovirales phage TaxID=2100421 RepID=A0A6J5MDM8_9CAUD|nr:hypothetical protein UFOVP468_55 [uncultured Caudovirales phage]
MGNISNTRFPFGLTNVNDVDLFADMVQPDPTLFHQYFQDFDTYVAGDWTVTETDAAATQALTAGDGGLLLVTNTAADNDLVALQKNPAAWTFTAGKKTFFRCRFKVSNATESDLVFGLQVVDATPLDVTDGVYFLKADGSTNVAIIARKNASTGSTTATAITTMANDTFIELGWCYDGQSTIAYEVNGTVLGSLDGSSSYLPDTTCTVSFALQNGNAVARTMTVDYIFVAKER